MMAEHVCECCGAPKKSHEEEGVLVIEACEVCEDNQVEEKQKGDLEDD